MKALFERARPWQHALAVYLLTVVLIWPLFRLKYYAGWSSIESTFISDARMLRDNLPHRHWQPRWYAGTRADYIYPPALRYGTALIAEAIDSTTARSYHLYCALLYALGIAAVWALVWTGTGSCGWAWLAAPLVALVSPSFLLMTELRQDSFWHEPQRLHVLMTYGEGPHMSALAWLPFALACAFIGLRRSSWRWIALAAFCAAWVVSNNFYGATALALLFPFVVWACFLERPGWSIWIMAAAVAVLAWGLCAWWLTPSYLRVTGRNLRLVAEPGNAPSVIVLVLLAIAFGLATWRLRHRLQAYPLFVCGALGIMTLYVLGRRWFHFQIAGESTRLIPEFDFVIVLGLVEALRFASWRRTPPWAIRVSIAVLLLAGLPYLKEAWAPFQKDPDWESRVEYKITRWIHENMPEQRVWAIGSVRLWYNAWFDITQLDGGSQQGLLNLHLATAQYRMVSDDIHLARLWLTALGVDAAVVSERDSTELYHDIANPERWHGQMPVIAEIERNVVYRIPRRKTGIVRLVDREKFAGIPTMPADQETPHLERYVAAVEAQPPGGPDDTRVYMQWIGTDALRINTDVRAGESVLLQETYDRAWELMGAPAGSRIVQDQVGFMRIEVPEGKHDFRVVFQTPLEVTVGRVLTILSLLAVGTLIMRRSSSHPQ